MPRHQTIDWKDAAQRRAYKAGFMRGSRLARFQPRPGITDLAYKVMCNEFERARYTAEQNARRAMKKKPNSVGNAAWQALGK